MRRIRVFLLGLALATNCMAVIPENGWWWASNESGRGFNIEIQNNLLFFASFGYESNGNPLWLISGGPMTSDRDYSGTLYRSSSGQCFGCPYVAPITVPAGSVALHFSSSQTAVLTINGFAISVKRFDFWLNEFVPDAMLGEWSYVIGSAGSTFDAERIDFGTKVTDSTGTYLSGFRLGSSVNSNPAALNYVPAGAKWTVLLDSSASFYRYFEFNQTGFNRVEGQFWVFAKGSSPAGSGTFFQAYRTASAAFLQTGQGPASTKRGANPDELRAQYEEIDARLQASLLPDETAEKSADPEVASRFMALEKYLRKSH